MNRQQRGVVVLVYLILVGALRWKLIYIRLYKIKLI